MGAGVGYRGRVDLRTQSQAELVAHVERAVGVRLRPDQAVCKRRSLGLPTERGTWARISVCGSEDAAQRGGLEGTAALPIAVRHPRWQQGSCWREGQLLWRVDETELITDPVVQSGGILTYDPELPQVWFQNLADALDTLTTVPTARVATPHTRPITQQRVTEMLQVVFPQIDATVEEWTVAHADLSWVNLTAPSCRVLDWEDWGIAPRGWDAATLLINSLAVPTLARQVAEYFAADLTSRTGRVCQLYACAELIAAGEDYAGPLAGPVREHADLLLTRLGYARLVAAGSA